MLKKRRMIHELRHLKASIRGLPGHATTCPCENHVRQLRGRQLETYLKLAESTPCANLTPPFPHPVPPDKSPKGDTSGSPRRMFARLRKNVLWVKVRSHRHLKLTKVFYACELAVKRVILSQPGETDRFEGQRQFELLVMTEDDRVIQKIKRLLEPGGYGVTVHHQGRAGLEALRSGLYMICLVDQDLMDISGFEVVGQGKEISPQTEFVMLFEYPNLSKALLALSYGAYGYLTKPLDDLGALLTKIILAREKISMRVQLRTLMHEFDKERAQPQNAEASPQAPAWATGVAADLHNT